MVGLPGSDLTKSPFISVIRGTGLNPMVRLDSLRARSGIIGVAPACRYAHPQPTRGERWIPRCYRHVNCYLLIPNCLHLVYFVTDVMSKLSRVLETVVHHVDTHIFRLRQRIQYAVGTFATSTVIFRSQIAYKRISKTKFTRPEGSIFFFDPAIVFLSSK